MADNSDIKARFGIIGKDPELLRAIDTAVQVAPIQLSALIIGESGSGKEAFPQIIHAFSARKHKPYVAVNCGAIPEGTIDSELFGHEKGAFTGALNERKGYFEEANTGTIFLDEIGELPLATQAKLLRVLEKGEYMRVGSSAVRKTDVRVVAATNVDLEKAIADGRFREDLFYRLNGILIRVPPLRKRIPEDIPALFHKFTCDFADRNHMPPVRLTEHAAHILKTYDWPGNVRQLKNVAEQLTVLAPDRVVEADVMRQYMPAPRKQSAQRADDDVAYLPQVDGAHNASFNSDREILYKVLFDLRNDVNDLKKLVLGLINQGGQLSPDNLQVMRRLFAHDQQDQRGAAPNDDADYQRAPVIGIPQLPQKEATNIERPSFIEEEDLIDEPRQSLSLADSEKETIIKALKKHGFNKRRAAKELQISERTLYRKIHDYGIDEE